MSSSKEPRAPGKSAGRSTIAKVLIVGLVVVGLAFGVFGFCLWMIMTARRD